MTIRIIATDMDGTFLDNQGSFDRERFGRVLNRLESAGIPFVVASGNSLERLLTIFSGFEERVIFLAENGGHLYQKGQTIFRKQLLSEWIRELLIAYQNQLIDYCVMVSSSQQIYMQEGAGLPFVGSGLAIEKVQLQAFLDRICFLPDLQDLPCDQPIDRVSFWVKEELAEQVTADFNQRFAGKMVAVTSGYGSISIQPAQVNKAWGLAQVLKLLEIKASDVLAFGDSDNDLELLAYAGHSYAMGNAHQGVKAVAKYLVPSHRESGVLTVIEAYLKGEGNDTKH